jgi:Domain of unknown function (DUF3601)
MGENLEMNAVSLAGGFFVLVVCWALWRHLAHRDQRNKLTVYTLRRRKRYQVIKAFRDYYGNEFTVGECLTFQRSNFLPYDGGHTIFFAEKNLYLQEEVNSDILNDLSSYLVAWHRRRG